MKIVKELLAKTVTKTGEIVGSVGRGIASAVAVIVMVGVYAVSSIGSYGLTALGLTGLTTAALATSAQPAQAHRRRYRHRRYRSRRRRWRGGWGPGIYLNIGPRRRRRRRYRRYRGW